MINIHLVCHHNCINETREATVNNVWRIFFLILLRHNILFFVVDRIQPMLEFGLHALIVRTGPITPLPDDVN